MSLRFADAAMDAISEASSEFPVVLYSTGTVAIGAETTLDADDLQNHFDRDIQIEEIRFLFWLNSQFQGAAPVPVSQVPNRGDFMANLAALVRTKLRMGRIDLTNGFVPTWLLGPKLQEAVEVMQGKLGNPLNSIWHYHKWKLPRPIIVPRGATLLPSFQYLLPDGTTTLTKPANSPITVHVALVGRSLSLRKLPSIIQVPYATAFVPNVAIQQQQSQDDQLVNKFNVPLHVQRLIGRITGQCGNNVLEAWARSWDISRTASISQEQNNNIATAKYGKLRITDSSGYLIVPQMTQWHAVFNPARASLEVGRILGPRGWYTVQLQDQPTNTQPSTYLPMISMLGWREEELSL